MNWQSFLSGLLGTTIPALLVALLVQRFTGGLNRSLEQFKFDLQRDTVRFSKWHERRVDACVTTYVAFSQFLDFLRQELYLADRPPMSMDRLYEFDREIDKQIVFLEDDLAEKVLRYKGELHAFRNGIIQRKQQGSDFTQTKMDYQIPAYLPRLRRDINAALDPTYDPKAGDAKSLLRFSESGERPAGMNARGLPESAPEAVAARANRLEHG
jgi:hypothetical protein